MFKKNKFTINQDGLTIYPYYDKLILLTVFAIFYILLLVFIFFLVQNPYNALADNFYLVLYASPIIFFLIVGYFASQISIVFDENEKAVYKKIFFIKKRLYDFEELHDIVLVNSNMGVYYKITSTRDKYGKGIRLSPSYGSINSKDILEFQERVLIRLQQMLSAQTSPQVKNPAVISNTFNYYSIENSVYRLKTSKKLMFWAVIVLVGAIYFNVKSPFDVNTHPPVGEYLVRAFGFLFPPIAAFIATRKLVFDANTQTIRIVYAFNGFKEEFAFSDFLRFQITHSRYNGIYSDTTVSLVFNSGKMLELKSFYKTKKIQDFVDETEVILKVKN